MRTGTRESIAGIREFLEPRWQHRNRWGLENTLLYSSDYPHWDGDWPHTVQIVRERKDLSEDSKRKMLHDNVARFYKLTP